MTKHTPHMLSIDGGQGGYGCLIYDRQHHMIHNLPYGNYLDETIEAVEEFMEAFQRTVLCRYAGRPWPENPAQLWLPGLEPAPKVVAKPRRETVTLEDLGL